MTKIELRKFANALTGLDQIQHAFERELALGTLARRPGTPLSRCLPRPPDLTR
jgi:hypothetical protein